MQNISHLDSISHFKNTFLYCVSGKAIIVDLILQIRKLDSARRLGSESARCQAFKSLSSPNPPHVSCLPPGPQ